ncbi:hypothetical protein [Allorhizocola rhizosphaerae]|uniref:hypothetical protein n=1 Tax=Allorhizocola rhizosphaerae TaxID=1872709 RepID=UPI001B8CCEB5|nr:hypothetical protein [Allorhizocola rhizosphaerae]
MSAEAHALLPWYRDLFTETQLDVAEKRLREHRFDVDTFLAQADQKWLEWAKRDEHEAP